LAVSDERRRKRIPGFGGRAIEFFADHPYGVEPKPYADGLPSDWPDYCAIVK
jgi:hypothetical protein